MKRGQPEAAAPAFLASDVPPAPADRAAFHVIPVPLEVSVSYGRGAAGGPAALLRASQQLEVFDGWSEPARAGIHTQAPVPCAGRAVEAVLAEVERRVAAALDLGAVPVLLGGEHTVSLAGVRALSACGPVGVVQFDAHADLREEYEGSRLSHACVMKRVLDLNLPLIQIGVRCVSAEERARRAGSVTACFDAVDLVPSGQREVTVPAACPGSVYLTLDVDALDPAVVPATGTPAPGGLGWYQTLDLIGSIAKQRRIAAFDVVELAPRPDLHAADFAAAQLTYAVMGMIERSWDQPVERHARARRRPVPPVDMR